MQIVTASDFALTYMVLTYGSKKWFGNSDDLDSCDGSGDGSLSVNKGNGDKKTKRGRKTGERGFAIDENMRIFNAHGEILDKLLYSGDINNERLYSWEKAAMVWLNRETCEVDEAIDWNVKKTDKVIPFVSRKRAAAGVVVARV